MGKDRKNIDGFHWCWFGVVGRGIVSQKGSRWRSQNGMLDIEPVEEVQSFVRTAIAKREAEVGWRIRLL